MRGIGGDVAEEGSIPMSFDEFQGLVEPNIGAIALIRSVAFMGPVGIIKIVVAPIIGRIPDTAPAVGHHFLKASILGAIGIVIAQMPLAKNAGDISILDEDVGHANFVLAQQGASADGMPNTGAVGVVAGQ